MRSRKEKAVAAPNGSKRRRNRIYNDRQVFSVRMGIDLNRRLLARCDLMQVPANTYITGLIQKALARPAPSPVVDSRVVRGEPRVNVSIRLSGNLHSDLLSYCAQAKVSATSFVCGLIDKDLKRAPSA